MALPQQTEIAQLSDTFLRIIDIKNRRHRGFTYRNVFVGSEAVDAMLDAGMANCRTEAIAIARRLEKELRLFSHVAGRHLFRDDRNFYRVSEKDSLLLTSCQYDPELLLEKAHHFRKLANVKDRKYRFKKYKNCFVGSEMIDAMVYTGLVQSRQEGVLLGRAIEQHLDWFRHVTGDHHFYDDYLFYRFNVAADILSAVSASSVSTHTPNAPTKPVSSAASITSSLSSSRSTNSPSAARMAKQSKALMLSKIEEYLKVNNYSEATVANLKLVMSELKHKVSDIYTGHHEIIESSSGPPPVAKSASSSYKPPAPLSDVVSASNKSPAPMADIVFRPPTQSAPEPKSIQAMANVNNNFVREESYEFDEFTIVEGDTEEFSDTESLYVEETIAEDDEDAYKFEARLSFLSSGNISAITPLTT
jgi:hypothetical protein